MPKSAGQRRSAKNKTTGQGAEDDEAVKAIAIGDFVDVTNADPEVARHVLEAHGWDVDEAVSFYLETGGVEHAHGAGMDVEKEERQDTRRRGRAASHPIVVRRN